MMEPTERRGLSRGCLVALIVVAVLLIIIIIAAATCWYYKDDLAKMATVSAIESLKTAMAENPPEAVDTVQFNKLADAFVARLNEEELDYERYSVFMQALQGSVSDQEISAEEAERLSEAMIEYFPDLVELAPEREPVDSAAIQDSAGLL